MQDPSKWIKHSDPKDATCCQCGARWKPGNTGDATEYFWECDACMNLWYERVMRWQRGEPDPEMDMLVDQSPGPSEAVN